MTQRLSARDRGLVTVTLSAEARAKLEERAEAFGTSVSREASRVLEAALAASQQAQVQAAVDTILLALARLRRNEGV